MWMVVMFDLPTETREDRHRYAKFRKMLLDNGYMMLQFSVYGRHCASDENADMHERRVIWGLPPQGQVRILRVTEKQFARMKTFYGKSLAETEKPPEQLSFF